MTVPDFSHTELVNELHDTLARQSLRFGDFTLTSGAKSKYYYDGKASTLSPRGSWLIGEALFRVLMKQKVEAVGGLTLGADFITTAVTVVSALHEQPIYGYVVRDGQKKHGTRKLIEESYHPDRDQLLQPGLRVAVVDDVVTKGGSMFKAIEAVTERGCEVAAVVTLVDRNAGGGELIREAKLPYFPLFNADSEGTLTVDEQFAKLAG